MPRHTATTTATSSLIYNFPLRNFVGIFILTIIIFFKVIVMELCTGGSLFNLLDDPENSYGLDEVRSFQARNEFVRRSFDAKSFRTSSYLFSLISLQG